MKKKYSKKVNFQAIHLAMKSHQYESKLESRLVCIANPVTEEVLRVPIQEAISAINGTNTLVSGKWFFCEKKIYKRYKNGESPKFIFQNAETNKVKILNVIKSF